MKGLELAEKFYKEFGEPMLKEQFSHILPFIAVGLAGSGSECYGYDDEISHDHDFEPAFCVFLPDETVVDRKTAFELERAYSKLQREFMGYKRSFVTAVGGNRHGVIRTADFFESKTGCASGRLSAQQWLSLPDYMLAEAVNGAVFCDNYGEFSAVRALLEHYPEDIRLKKLAGNLLLMGQAGQYNYKRCIERNETGAAQLAVNEFVRSAINTVFLLNKKYAPYYKWSFRAMRELSEEYAVLSTELEFLLSSGNNSETVVKKSKMIEDICYNVSLEIKRQNIADAPGAETEWLAYAVNDKIADSDIRNMNVLCAV